MTHLLVTGLNPSAFKALDTQNLLQRAGVIDLLDPATATLLRWAALEIDSLRDALLEAHGVTVVDGSAPAGASIDQVAVTLIEPHFDAKYGHTFKLTLPKGA